MKTVFISLVFAGLTGAVSGVIYAPAGAVVFTTVFPSIFTVLQERKKGRKEGRTNKKHVASLNSQQLAASSNVTFTYLPTKGKSPASAPSVPHVVIKSRSIMIWTVVQIVGMWIGFVVLFFGEKDGGESMSTSIIAIPVYSLLFVNGAVIGEICRRQRIWSGVVFGWLLPTVALFNVVYIGLVNPAGHALLSPVIGDFLEQLGWSADEHGNHILMLDTLIKFIGGLIAVLTAFLGWWVLRRSK
jgi:hypothetical protein